MQASDHRGDGSCQCYNVFLKFFVLNKQSLMPAPLTQAPHGGVQEDQTPSMPLLGKAPRDRQNCAHPILTGQLSVYGGPYNLIYTFHLKGHLHELLRIVTLVTLPTQ